MKKSVSAGALRASLCMALLVCANLSVASAQSIPAPWMSRDIGSPAPAGSSTFAAGVFTINAGGADIWGTSDQFRFIYQQISGDTEIIARVESLGVTDPYAKVGVMVRDSLGAGGAHGTSLLTASHGLRFSRRLTPGGLSTSSLGPVLAVPVWLRAKRVGTIVTSYYSTTGTSWTIIGSATIPLGSSAYVGVAVTSHNTSALTTAKVSNVNVVGGTSASGTLPAGQTGADIGAPALAGSSTYTTGSYTIKAAGTDIWGAADQFRFVYQPVTGDVEIVARVASMIGQHEWSKAGVMVRESLTAASRHASALTSAAKGYAFQRRAETGGYSTHTSGGSGTAPGWVRLVRTANLFESYRSADGTTWTKMGSDTIAMGETVYVGLAATSHNVSAGTTVVMDRVKVTASTTAGNRFPSVSVTAPINGTQITAPATVTLTASASDPENRMASVDFYAGPTLIGRDSTAPYLVSWSATTGGTYPLTAVAHDADGGSTTSGAVSVTVNPANRPPTVSLTTSGTSFVAPASITLGATASDPEGRLARVEFFAGTSRLASDTTAPYGFSWTNVVGGTYVVTAVTYDTAGASATSAAVTIIVAAASTAVPTAVAFTASTDHATNVTSYLFKVFAAGANTATAAPVATLDLGKPTPTSTGEIMVYRSAFFNALPAGSYAGTVTAIGPGGQTTSSSVTFSR